MSPLEPVRRLLPGHLGDSVSALLDGQLDEESAERAWRHVASCPSCRRLVEHEGWVKRQLSQIAGGPCADAHRPPDQLVGSLLSLDPSSSPWGGADLLEDSGPSRRRVGLVLVGAGSLSAAVLGLGLSGALSGVGGGSPATSIGGSHATPTRATPARATLSPSSPTGVPGRLRGWSPGSGDSGIAHAHTVGSRP
jgi:anti-sigma factor RsiW